MNLHKPSFHDFKFMMNLLDNPDSYIHHKTFRSLKETFIKNLTTEYWIDSYGDIYHSKESKEFQRMKTFREYNDDDFDDESLYIDEEGAPRGISAAVLFNRVFQKSREVKRTRDVAKKMNLIAQQNTTLAALIFAMTQFRPTRK